VTIAGAGVVALGGVWLANGPAEAYPPSTSMNVVAVSITPTPPKDKYVVALEITNAPPNCTLKITVNDETVGTATTGPSATGVTVLTSVTLRPSRDKTSTIKVKSACKPKETATTKVRLARAHLEGPSECKRYKKCEIEAENYPPNQNVVFTATKENVAQSIVRTRQTSGDGHAQVDFSFPESGAWAIVGASGGESHTWWVQVKK
jgi:hypothetical protein